MKKEVAIEQVFLAVGGKPSADTNIKRVDVEPYLSAALAETIGIGAKELWMQTWRGKRAGMPTNNSYSASYLTYEYTPVLDPDRCVYKVETIKPLIIDFPFMEVNPMKGESFIRTLGQSEAFEMNTKAELWWYERNETFTLFLKTYKEKVLVKMIPDFYAMDWESEIAMPEDKMRAAIDLAVNFFLRERTLSDSKINQIDDATMGNDRKDR